MIEVILWVAKPSGDEVKIYLIEGNPKGGEYFNASLWNNAVSRALTELSRDIPSYAVNRIDIKVSGTKVLQP